MASSRASSTAPALSETSSSSGHTVRSASSWQQPVTPPRSETATPASGHHHFHRSASAEGYASRKRSHSGDACDEEEARRVKMYSKRDGAKLMKEYEHAKDPSLVEVAADQRCNRCMRNQWRCFIEADPNSPRRVCRPCGKNKCSFGNAKARPQVIAPLPKQSPDPYPKQEPLEHNPHLAPSHLPYHHPSPVAWQSYPLHPGASSAVQHDRMLDRPAHRESFRPFNFHGRSHHEPRMSIPHPPVQVQVEHRARSQTHSQASQSPPPSLVESPPSPSAHIYRRGSHCTQSSAASPRTPPEEVSHEWSRSRMLSVSDAAAPAYNAVPQIPREQSLAAIRGLMATTREMMGRLAELEAQLVRQ